jgi:hypothetical protein
MIDVLPAVMHRGSYMIQPLRRVFVCSEWDKKNSDYYPIRGATQNFREF